MSQYQQVYMMGRCSNGAERDSGTLVHLRQGASHWALCGKAPGLRSAGWSAPIEGEIPSWCRSCARCTKLAAKIEKVLAEK
jgi:hypothetical protein